MVPRLTWNIKLGDATTISDAEVGRRSVGPVVETLTLFLVSPN